MKNKAILIEMLIDKAEQYGKTNIELYKLKAIDKSTDVFASLASRIVVFIIFVLFFFLFTVGLALFLGDVLGKSYYGFFAIAGFYFVIAIIMLIIRKPFLEVGFNNYIINQIFKEKENVDN